MPSRLKLSARPCESLFFPLRIASSSCSLFWNTSRSTDSCPLPPCTSTEGPNTSCSFRQEEMADRTTINPHTSLVVFILCFIRYSDLGWAPKICLKENPPFGLQRYKTNSISLKEAAFRHRSPYNSPQTSAEEHRLTQRSNNRLHTKIAPSRGLTKNLSQAELKRTSTGHRSEQYWSRLRPVLVTTTDQYWSHRRPVLVDFLLPHRIPQVQLIPMQLFALELW